MMLQTRSRKKKIIIIGGVLSFLAIGLGIWYLYENRNVTKNEFKKDIENIVYMEQGKIDKEELCIVSTEENFYSASYYLSEGFLMMFDLKWKTKKLSKHSLREMYIWEKAEMKIYDIEQEEYIKMINVDQLVKENIQEYQLDMGVPDVYEGEMGNLYLEWLLVDIPSKESIEEKRLRMCMDYDTGEITFHEKQYGLYVKSEKQKALRNEMEIFDDWGVGREYPFVTANGFKEGGYEGFFCMSMDISGLVKVRLNASELPQENEELYNRFPGLKEYQGREDLKVEVILTDYPTAEDVMKMFIEEGAEVSFEGCVLSGERSIDGEEHEIHSFEEYYQWVKPRE